MKTDLSHYTTGDYRPGGSLLKRLLWYYINAYVLDGYLFPFSGLRVRLLRLFGARVGKGVRVKPKVNVKYPWRLTIGDYTWIGEGVWIDNLEDIHIGNHVCISQGAMLLCGNHNYKDPHFGLRVEGITIEDGVWVGARSTVCPGVTLSEGAVVSVGAIVTKNVPAYQIFAGAPAVFRRQRTIEPLQ